MFRKLYRRFKRLIYGVSEKEYVADLKEVGISVGGGIRIFDPKTTKIDKQNPHLLKIGDNVRITAGCIILTHDYSWSVVAGVTGYIYGGTGIVTIGNNVFIGVNSIVLKDTIIGDNVIIGAGSVISGNVESNSVYAGVPAKKICSLDEYVEKLKKRSLDMCKKNVEYIQNNTGKATDETVLREYFYLYKERSELLSDDQIGLMKRTGYYTKCMETYKESIPILNIEELK